ncbi:MAG: hypothetical protein EBZ77_04070 [Chitinophagia bacterium]|nr:hypothetical protein [Chitinophagia bacterium]
MKKLLLLSLLLLTFFACKKEDNKEVTSYSKAVEGMGYRYNKAYVFYLDRSTINGTVRDSDFVIFRSNGSITEVGNRFDSGSYVYPDTLTYVVNTSFNSGIFWNNNPNINLMNLYPLYDGVRGFLLHDYLNTSVVSLYRPVGSSALNAILVTPTLTDSVAKVTGFVK